MKTMKPEDVPDAWARLARRAFDEAPGGCHEGYLHALAAVIPLAQKEEREAASRALRQLGYGCDDSDKRDLMFVAADAIRARGGA